MGKMDKKKLTLLIISSSISLCIIAFFIDPLLGEQLTYKELFNEGYFKYILLFPILFFFDGFNSSILGLFLLTGIGSSIFKIYQKQKLFPFYILFIVFFCIYIFIGMIIFGIRNGEFLP